MSLPPPELKVAELNLYPLKSCAQLRVTTAQVGTRGLVHDRRWLVVDTDGQFLTGRERPALVSIRAEPSANGLRLSAPRMEPLSVEIPDGRLRRPVKVWSDTVDAARCDSANAWLSTVLGMDAALVYMDERAERPTDPKYSQLGDSVSFADGYPVLLTTQSSLADLNQRLALKMRKNARAACSRRWMWKRFSLIPSASHFVRSPRIADPNPVRFCSV
jgi:uncharacterized protein